MDADLRLVVDRTGRVAVPRVGAIQVAGVRLGDLRDVISQRVGRVFRNFELSVSLGQLRGIRVFVTGNVLRPGTHHVGSLSTVLTALMRAGGPSAAGTLRQIEIRRDAKLVGSLDLYDLLVNGNRRNDRVLQPGDVVHVGPVGPQVAVLGSVNKPAVIELRAGDTVAEALRLAGDFTPVADRRRLTLERLQDRLNGRIEQLALPAQVGVTLATGDVLRAFSDVDTVIPTQQQSKRVRVEGEVRRPGDYVLPAASTINDAIRAAGGLTGDAYLFATEFTRDSVRATQQQNYERVLRDLETSLTLSASTRRVSNVEDVAQQQAALVSQSRLIERLRALKPNGRLVLEMSPRSDGLPHLVLEDGDRLYIPQRPSTVGVFGSVFNPSAYLYVPGRTVKDFLRVAGGPTKGADATSLFVVRANGGVVSNLQGSGLLRRGTLAEDAVAEPGDTVFVPEELNKSTWLQGLRDWTQVLYQLGVGAAGIKSAIQ